MSRKGKAAVFVVLCMFCVGALFGVNTNVANFWQVEAATSKGIVTAYSLNVRKGPGTEYDPVTQNGKYVYLFENDVVKILSESNGFYKVKFTYNKKTVTGYSNKAYIKLVTGSTPKPTVKPTATPKATTKPKTTPKPSTVILDDNTIPNAPVKSSTKTVTGLKYTGKVTASALRVRVKADTKADELEYKNKKVRLYKGDKFTITQQKIVKGVVWYYGSFTFEKKTLKGYVLSDYIKLTFSETVKGKIYSNAKVTVRNTAGVTNDYLLDEDDQKVSIKDGKSVKILKEATANGKKWFRISFTYGGETMKGYILANLVAFEVSQPKTPSPSPTIKPTATPKVTTKPAATVTPKITATVEPNVSEVPVVKGLVSGNVRLNVRIGAGTNNNCLQYNGENVVLEEDHVVRIMEEVFEGTDNEKWYGVEFNYNGVELKGYVMAKYILKVESSPSSDLNNVG